MPGFVTFVVTVVASALVAASAVAEPYVVSQSAAFEAEDEVRNISAKKIRQHDQKDRHLAISRQVAFEPFDASLGTLQKVRIEMHLFLEQGFSGVIGDDAPLDEAPGPVEVYGRLSTRVDVVGPDGGFLHAEVFPSAVSGCASEGTCAFAHDERREIMLAFDPNPRVFSGEKPVKFTIRGTSIGGVISQICASADGWDNCQIRQARIGLTVPREGIRLTYQYAPAPPPKSASLMNPDAAVLSVDRLAIVGALLLVGLIAGLTIGLDRRRPR